MRGFNSLILSLSVSVVKREFRMNYLAYLPYLIRCSVEHSIWNTLSLKLRLMYAMHRVYEAFINCIPFRQHIKHAAPKFSEFNFSLFGKMKMENFKWENSLKFIWWKGNFCAKCQLWMHDACETCVWKLALRTNRGKFINNLQRFVFDTEQMHAHSAPNVCVHSIVVVYLPFKYSHQIHMFSMQEVQDIRNERQPNECGYCINEYTKHFGIRRGACNKTVCPKTFLTNQDEWILFKLVLPLERERESEKINKSNYAISCLKHLIQFGIVSYRCTNLNHGEFFPEFSCGSKKMQSFGVNCKQFMLLKFRKCKEFLNSYTHFHTRIVYDLHYAIHIILVYIFIATENVGIFRLGMTPDGAEHGMYWKKTERRNMSGRERMEMQTMPSPWIMW